jgi:hypothetical protein
MDGQRPPNDPSNGNGDRGKAAPPSQRQDQRANGGGVELNENGEMDMIGNDMRDQGVVVMMFLFGLASFLLREKCIC